MYKQIDFDEDIKPMLREVSAREQLLSHGTLSGVTPILAVVVNGDPPLLYGLVLPYAGPSLDKMHGQITLQHVISLVKTVMAMSAAGVVHGDICDRNVCCRESSIQLIDFGDWVRDDIVATGELLSYMERMVLDHNGLVRELGTAFVVRNVGRVELILSEFEQNN
jgi:hypothetical protein